MIKKPDNPEGWTIGACYATLLLLAAIAAAWPWL